MGGELPDVERDVEVQGVGPGARDPDVLRPLPHPLDGGHDLERQLRLGGPHEHDESIVLRLQGLQSCRLDVLEIDQDHVASHEQTPRSV